MTTVTFDCYGTLAQWPERLRELLTAIGSRHGVAARSDSLLAEFRANHHALVTGPYRPYTMLLREALRTTFAAHGATLQATDDDILVAGITAIPPYPDVPPALAKLASRYRLVVISNSEDELIQGTIASLGARIDRVITAQQAGAYKPSTRMCQFALRNVGCSRGEIVHVAAGLPYDVLPAAELGLRTVWVNRTGADETDVPADRIMGSLDELPDALYELTGTALRV